MNWRYQALLLLLVLATSTSGLAEPPTVHCPTDPPAVRRLQLQERWRIDAEDPEAPLLSYFDPYKILLHDGQVYLLDPQLCHILVYSDDGEYLRTIMREGDGPGETRDPYAMYLCADGRIAVQHGYPTRLEFVDTDGTPRGSWQVQATTWILRLQETPLGWFGVYSASKQSQEPGQIRSEFHAAIHDEQGARTHDFYREERRTATWPTGRTDEAENFNPWHRAVYAGDGQVLLAAARDEYRLEWRNLAGEVTRVVTRDFPAHRRTREELEVLKYSDYTISNGEFRFHDRKLCEHDRMILALEPRPDGSLRVRTSLFDKELPEGMVCRFEVHEPTGELRERVEIYDLTGDYEVELDGVALLDDGRAMVLRNLHPAIRAVHDAGMGPEQLEKRRQLPQHRQDVTFVPIMCDLVPVAD